MANKFLLIRVTKSRVVYRNGGELIRPLTIVYGASLGRDKKNCANNFLR
jgi:hypothetical protein